MYPEYLWNPAFGKGIPFVFPKILFGQCDTVLEGDALPAGLHEIADVGMGVALRIREDLPVVLSPELERRGLVKSSERCRRQTVGWVPGRGANGAHSLAVAAYLRTRGPWRSRRSRRVR